MPLIIELPEELLGMRTSLVWPAGTHVSSDFIPVLAE